MATRSGYPPPVVGRLIVVILTSVAVEGIRFSLHGHRYTPKAWILIIGAGALNFFWHWWALEHTYVKVAVSSIYKQSTLPYAALYLWGLLANIIREPPS